MPGGGGVQGQNLFFLVLYYVIALVISFFLFFDILNFRHFVSNPRSKFGPFLPGAPKNETKAAEKWVDLKMSKNGYAVP